MSVRNNLLSDDRMLFRETKRDQAEYWSSTSHLGMVSSAHYRATEAGLRILERGGNAFDAAIAVSLALGVVEPAGSGLGGMAMAMVHLAGENRTFVVEAPCRAPLRSSAEAAAQASRRSGYRAIAVPTSAAMLDYLLKKYGTLTRQELLEPAISLAREGFPVSNQHHELTKAYLKGLATHTAAVFMLTPEKTPPLPGSEFRQPVLARTLRRLADAGFEDFYQGEIGKRILRDVQTHGGFLSELDFASIPYPKESEPLNGQFFEWEIRTMPPPGGGVTLIQALNLAQELAGRDFDIDSPAAALFFASVIQRSRYDRRRFRLGHPTSEIAEVPDLTGRQYAETAAKEMRTAYPDLGETSHFCIVDRFGNWLSQTQSIERCFGSKCASADLGFLYNGYMKTFKVQNKRHPFYMRPGAAARSNAAPTIVFENGKPKIAIGSTGSERMNSGILQVLVGLRHLSPFEAVKAPRLHCSPDKEVFLEAPRYSQEAQQMLIQNGFTLHPLQAWSFKVGGLHLVTSKGDALCGVAEPRRGGAAAGPEK